MRALLVIVALFLSGPVSAQTNNCGGVGQVSCNVAVTSGGGGSVTQGTSPWVTSTPDVRALDQTINSATPSAAYAVPVNGQGEVGFSISGLTASTAVLTPECTNNIGAASPVWAGCMAISGSALNATITADGAYRVESGGRTGVRLRVTTTGTGTITISSTAAATSSLSTMAQSLPAGTNVIGHVIADTGSTTAVTSLPGSPMQATGGTVTTNPGQRTLVSLDVASVTTGGSAVTALTAGHATAGGFIYNPVAATVALCINQIGVASGVTSAGNTTCIQPGQPYNIVPSANAVSVISSDSTHAFSGMGLQ